MSTTTTHYPPPSNLTPHITRIGDQYSAGGGFGDVYKCLYHGSSGPKEVAVKAFRFSFTMEGHSANKSTNMLRRELGIWRRLNHDNIVPFLGIAYGFGMSNSRSLVSLWMPNESLQKFLVMHDDKLDVQHRLQLLLDIANGLNYLHSFPITHGDLNCNNVLLDADYTARLTDFGYSSLVGNIPEALMYLQRSTARPGALRWVAPEQISLEGTFTRTIKSDIYSFGCVSLQVLSGKQPWAEVGEDAAVVLCLVRGCKPQRPESRKMDDLHWSLIQDCWSPVAGRPAAEAIAFTIHNFLRDCPSSRPLRQIFMAQGIIAHPSLEHIGLHGDAKPSASTAQSLPDTQHDGNTDSLHPDHSLNELSGENIIGHTTREHVRTTKTTVSRVVTRIFSKAIPSSWTRRVVKNQNNRLSTVDSKLDPDGSNMNRERPTSPDPPPSQEPQTSQASLTVLYPTASAVSHSSKVSLKSSPRRNSHSNCSSCISFLSSHHSDSLSLLSQQHTSDALSVQESPNLRPQRLPSMLESSDSSLRHSASIQELRVETQDPPTPQESPVQSSQLTRMNQTRPPRNVAQSPGDRSVDHSSTSSLARLPRIKEGFPRIRYREI